MGGIINYIHGESGIVESLAIETDEHGQVFRVLRMTENPLRHDTVDYGCDIRIDPTLQAGERVCYVRLDSTCGYWLRQSERFEPELSVALERYIYPRANDVRQPGALTRSCPKALTDASIFLSHSSWNKVYARFLRIDLEKNGRTTVWLDEERDAPDLIEEKLLNWLHSAIHQAKGIVFLWSHACMESSWVRREIEWATSLEATIPIVVINCDGTEVPTCLAERSLVISVDGLWYANGVGEEVFTYLHGLEPRSKWLAENAVRGTTAYAHHESNAMSYDDIAGHEGIAETDVVWDVDDQGTLAWHFSLRDRKTGELKTISGPSKVLGNGCRASIAVDFGIKKGDRVARLASYRTSAYGWSRTYYSLVWMRIDQPQLRLEWVDSCCFVQSRTAKVIKGYSPKDVDLRLLPKWFDAKKIAGAHGEYATEIEDIAAILVAYGARLFERSHEVIFQLHPEDYDWIPYDIVARYHDACVFSMKEDGIQWCPHGFVREGFNHMAAPFDGLDAEYKEHVSRRVASVITAILSSGIDIVIPRKDSLT